MSNRLSEERRMKPTKATKTQQSAGKVMSSLFWDSHGMITMGNLEKGKISKSKYSLAILVRFNGKNRKKTDQNEEDNAPFHKSITAVAKLLELHFELLPDPPYSSDLEALKKEDYLDELNRSLPRNLLFIC